MISLKTIDAIQPGQTVWDDGKGAVAGFGARRQKGVAVAYMVKFRTTDGRQRWLTIGRHGAPWTPDTARAEAKRILAEVAKGADPAQAKADARKAPTIADLCREYLAKAEAGKLLTRRKEPKKASTVATDKGRIERHVVPLLGRLKVAAVTSKDVERFQEAVADGETAARIKTGRHGLARVTGGRGTATRTMGLLGAIFSYAVKQGMRYDNPVRGVERHADGKRERRLSAEEYAALGEALRTMPNTAWPVAIQAARFLALTGWRRGEMLALRWCDVDMATRTARLVDTKTGASMRPLSHGACDVLRALPRLGDLVFPSSVSIDKPMAGFNKVWLRVVAKASLPADVTPHICRHSLASIAADMGYSELTIAALIGHKKASVTSRYTHHTDAVLLAAADAVASNIAELMGDGQPAGIVVTFPKSSGAAV